MAPRQPSASWDNGQVITQRTLISVPVIHSQGDQGSLGSSVPAPVVQHPRPEAWWDEVQQQVRMLALDWLHVKVYQDGLPDVDPAIVRKILAEVASPNYQLLRWLIVQGAEAVGTESPDLLKEEYRLLQAVVTQDDPVAKLQARRRYAQRADAILIERDRYIARRIASTLPSASTGLLFIGQAHRVERELPPDIKVQQLLINC
ncbi:MAG: hypothetical protein M1118_15950 [Chloroflexi bacterium]|nr:hypothetical protein [Chloroflexota bacterium]